jgi:hypothetical protein
MSEQTETTQEPTTETAPDTAAELAAAKAQIAEFASWKAKIESEAEEKARASMTEAQKLAADREALTAKEKALSARARSEALTKLGVLEKAHQWAPDVDPATPAGAKALEDWARANPELIKAQAQTGHAYDAPADSSLGKLLRGALPNALINAKRAAELLSRSK